eukprot:GHVR01159944.1.p1 GENE.GHVR01159944.1~~GHVR01159944.1.p1  ORF type:complete len:139 (-),score=13.79 GHVR01159944.1:192-608(-)
MCIYEQVKTENGDCDLLDAIRSVTADSAMVVRMCARMESLHTKLLHLLNTHPWLPSHTTQLSVLIHTHINLTKKFTINFVMQTQMKLYTSQPVCSPTFLNNSNVCPEHNEDTSIWIILPYLCACRWKHYSEEDQEAHR